MGFVRYGGTISAFQGSFPQMPDDTVISSLSWSLIEFTPGFDWSFWSSPSPLDIKTVLGLRDSGGWCPAVYELLTLHYQRPALYRLDNYGKYHSCI